jgi:hypothetical protein
MTREDPSPVDRLPKVGEVWRLAATRSRPSIEAMITEVTGDTLRYDGEGYKGKMWFPVFRASARFLRERG